MRGVKAVMRQNLTNAILLFLMSVRAAAQMIKVVESENPPLRLSLGEDALMEIEVELEAVRKDLAPWRAVSVDTAFEGAAVGAIGGK